MKKFFLILFVISNIYAFAQTTTNALVVLDAINRAQVESAIGSIESKGAHVRHIFEPEILLCYIPDGNDNYIKQCDHVVNILRSTADPNLFASKISKHAAVAFNNLYSPNTILNQDNLFIDSMNNKASLTTCQYFSTNETPAPDEYTSSFMAGSISVGIMLMESNGGTENWSLSKEEKIISELVQGLNRLTDQAYEKNNLIRWDYDIHYAVPTNFEPISGKQVPYLNGLVWHFEWIDDALSYRKMCPGSINGFSNVTSSIFTKNQTPYHSRQPATS